MESGAHAVEPRLRVDKVSDGQVTCLRLAGTIDEQFEGKRLAGTVKGGTLVLDLGEVRKISSFGCREWVDFVGEAGERVGELLLVECAPKVIDQLNMVLNFAGKGRVYSFYAPYRCDYCDVERRVLLQVDRDLDAIKALKPPEQPCESCGNPSYFDEDPASYFSFVAQQPGFELDPGVAAFLSSKLSYEVEGGARRFRAEKQVEGRATYLRLSGDLDGTFPADKVAEGLEGTLVVDLAGTGKIDPAGAAAWRAFLVQVSATCERIWLVSCPPVFLERLARAEDLGRAAVLSLTIPYTCQRCAATASHTIDVDEHFDVLKFATAPDVTCPDCGGPTVCAGSEALLAHLGALSRPEAPREVQLFVAAARERRPAAAAAIAAPPVPRPSSVPTILMAAAAAALVAVAVVLGASWLGGSRPRVAASGAGALVERSAAERPAWVSEAPPACEGASCTGVSSLTTSVAEGRGEAIDAALEAGAEQASASLPSPVRELVAPLYGPARQKALAGPEITRDAIEGRHAVAELVRASSTEPAPVTEEYWERYERGTRVWVRVAAARARAIEPASALGATATAIPPSLAWRYPTLRGGALLVAIDEGPLRDAGLTRGDIVLEVEGAQVSSPAMLAERLTEAHERAAREGGAIRLSVKSGDGEPRTFNVAVPRLPSARTPRTSSGADRVPALPTGGVNVWDRTGGGSVRDNPDE